MIQYTVVCNNFLLFVYSESVQQVYITMTPEFVFSYSQASFQSGHGCCKLISIVFCSKGKGMITHIFWHVLFYTFLHTKNYQMLSLIPNSGIFFFLY